MFRLYVRRLVAAALLLLAPACSTTPAKPDAPPPAAKPAWVEEPDADGLVKITIVGTNDLHGWIEPHERAGKDRGSPVLGGSDVFAGYLKILREKRPGGIVLLDGGDIFQGTLVANMTEGESVIRTYNALDYDALAIGNHEFDYGPEGEPVVAETPADDPVGNLKKRIEGARFPFLAGNVVDKTTGKHIDWSNVRRTALVERKGVRIGIIGLSTPLTPSVTLAQNVKNLDFTPLEPATLELAADLRRNGAQLVVLVLHAGTGCNPDADAHDLHGCDPKGELYKLLMTLPPGTVDAAVAGHTHQYLSHFVNGTPAIQSSSFGVAFGVIELWYDKKKNEPRKDRSKIWKTQQLCRRWFENTKDCRKNGEGPVVPAEFMGEEVRPDLKVAELVRDQVRIVEDRKNEKLGPKLVAPFRRSRVEESELGDLVTDIMRQSIRGAHVAATNSGGLRQDLEPGALRYGDVFNALPFENRLATIELTGKQLVAFLRQGVGGDHGIMQVSGVKVQVLDRSQEPCDPNAGRLLSATFSDGSPIDENATYTLVTNDFVAGGGDGYDKVLAAIPPAKINVRNDLPALREIVVTHLRLTPGLSGPVKGPERITFQKRACDAAAQAP